MNSSIERGKSGGLGLSPTRSSHRKHPGQLKHGTKTSIGVRHSDDGVFFREDERADSNSIDVIGNDDPIGNEFGGLRSA